MKIIVSGKRKELTDGLTVAQLIGSETTVIRCRGGQCAFGEIALWESSV